MEIGYDIVIRLQCKFPFAEFEQMKFMGGILMKRVFAFMLTIVVFLSLSACDGGSSASIEPTIWVMSSIQRADDGAVIYCSANEKNHYVGADVRDITCHISGSSIEILNNETSEKWNGTYRLLDSDDTSSIYEATIEDAVCQMVKSVTGYKDETEARDTLILSCEDYVLNFFAQE